jgi:hypothetical protein
MEALQRFVITRNRQAVVTVRRDFALAEACLDTNTRSLGYGINDN